MLATGPVHSATIMAQAHRLTHMTPRAPPPRTNRYTHPKPHHRLSRQSPKHITKAGSLPPDASSLPSDQQEPAAAQPPQPTSNGALKDIPRLQDLLSKRPRWPSINDARLPLWLRLVLNAGHLVLAHLTPLLLLHCVMDTVVFFLHRVSHRATNALAVTLLPAVSVESLGNPWWLSNNPEVATWATGYQALGLIVFLAIFPVELALRSMALAITGILVSRGPEEQPDQPRNPLRGVAAAWASIATAWSSIAPAFRRVFAVDVRVALRVIPLQLASWLVLPLPWTLPRMVVLQMAQPLAVVEGAGGDQALESSREMMEPIVWQYAGADCTS